MKSIKLFIIPLTFLSQVVFSSSKFPDLLSLLDPSIEALKTQRNAVNSYSDTLDVTYELPESLTKEGRQTIPAEASQKLMAILKRKAQGHARLDQRRYESSAMVSPEKTEELQTLFHHFLIGKHRGKSGLRAGTPANSLSFVLTGIGRQFVLVNRAGLEIAKFRIRTRKYVQVFQDSTSYSIKPSPGFEKCMKLEIKVKDLLFSNDWMKHSIKVSVIVNDSILHKFYEACASGTPSKISAALKNLKNDALGREMNSEFDILKMVDYLEAMVTNKAYPVIDALMTNIRSALEFSLPYAEEGKNPFKLQMTIDRNIRFYLLDHNKLWPQGRPLNLASLLLLHSNDFIRVPWKERYCFEIKRPIIKGDPISDDLERLMNEEYSALAAVGGKNRFYRDQIFNNPRARL